MKLFVRRHGQEEYHYQLYSYPFILEEIKPGSTLCILRSAYHIDRVKYCKSDLKVYATKEQVFEERN